MKFEQVIEKLKSIFGEVGDFVSWDYLPRVDNYQESIDARQVRYEFQESNKNWCHVGTKEYEEYKQLPNPYEIANRLYRESLDIKWEDVQQQLLFVDWDYFYTVKYFPDYDIYIKIEGYYDKLEGMEFYSWEDSCEEVFPTEKTITIYE